MPRNEKGEYYSRRIDLSDKQEVRERLSSAREGARMGGKIGSIVPLGGTAVGTTLGAISGFILGDQETVFPIDMIAIPAYQAYLLSGTPAFQIYIKEGEVLTQVIPTDAMEAVGAASADGEPSSSPSKKPRKKSKYHTAYGKHFKAIQNDYKLKNGKWKKNGFKRCGQAARKLARAEV
ncbi:unnamed protein product, partial [marine sediment metagenome]